LWSLCELKIIINKKNGCYFRAIIKTIIKTIIKNTQKSMECYLRLDMNILSIDRHKVREKMYDLCPEHMEVEISRKDLGLRVKITADTHTTLGKVKESVSEWLDGCIREMNRDVVYYLKTPNDLTPNMVYACGSVAGESQNVLEAGITIGLDFA
tara:strand:- start:1568 stop:2029 length:462 start_codon:yes stop_codon:yes gene_type:complete